MNKIKKDVFDSLKGKAGRSAAGAFLGALITRLVDGPILGAAMPEGGNVIWEALGLGAFLAIFFFILHIMIFGNESN